MTGQPIFSRFNHVGIVVRDLDKAVEYYESLGIGPFRSETVTLTERTVRGKPANDMRNRAIQGRMGQGMMVLCQPIAGESNIFREFLESKGEGVHHIAFTSGNLEGDTARLVKKGLKVLSTGKFAQGGGFTYFDTTRIGGVALEIIQWPSKQS